MLNYQMLLLLGEFDFGRGAGLNPCYFGYHRFDVHLLLGLSQQVSLLSFLVEGRSCPPSFVPGDCRPRVWFFEHRNYNLLTNISNGSIPKQKRRHWNPSSQINQMKQLISYLCYNECWVPHNNNWVGLCMNAEITQNFIENSFEMSSVCY